MTTPRRTVRVSEEVWDAASARAKAEGRTVTDVIIKGLQRYGQAVTAEPEPREPDPVPQTPAPKADPGVCPRAQYHHSGVFCKGCGRTP